MVWRIGGTRLGDDDGAPALRELDWLMAAVVFLCCLGLVMSVAIGGVDPGEGALGAMKSQGGKLLFGVGAFFAAAMVPLWWLRRLALPLLGIATLLCLLVQLFPAVNGANRWLRFAGYSFQPVELARFALILYCAAWIGFAEDGLRSFRTGFVPLMVPGAVLSMVLILQPDVGNAAFVLVLVSAMALAGGVPIWHFLLAGLPLALGVVFVVLPYGHVQDRLTGFLDPEPGGQVWQSLIAISSGGLFGAGLGNGWMKMGFVPEAGNDFVFAIIGEELGFAGSLLVLGLYLAIGIVGVRLVMRMQDSFCRMLVFGLSFAVCMQAAINLLVVTGMAPPKGIDLPFLSSGGTNLVFSLGAIGLIGNAARCDMTDAEI